MTRLRITALFLILVSILTSFASCTSEYKTPSSSQVQNTDAVDVTFPEFDEKRAFRLCAQQVAFGPRVPNTKSHADCQSFIMKELEPYVDTMFVQSFSRTVYGRRWDLSHIVARIGPDNAERVMFAAHWDSRPRSDEDTDYSNYNKGVPAANDGGSGVAVLLELARVFHSKRPEVGIDLVFFDGEDIGYKTDGDMFCLGSQYFAQNFPLPVRPRYAIVLDMVGDKEARFLKEQGSLEAAPVLVDKVWQLGRIHAPDYFPPEAGSGVTDDHRPLIGIGIPAIDIIDMELIGNQSSDPRRHYWHTQKDTMDNIGERTLYSVATVLLHLVYGSPFVM
ncbi:MAG: M28 family peptidase [Candidatus Kapaibacterium sp.]